MESNSDEIEYVELLNTQLSINPIEMSVNVNNEEEMHEIITIAEPSLMDYEQIQYVEAEVEVNNTLITEDTQTIFIHEGRKYIIPNDQLTNGEHTIILDEEDGQLIEEPSEDIFYTVDENEEEPEKLEEIRGKNLITGQTISLSGILEKMRRKSTNDLLNTGARQPRNIHPPIQQSQDYILVPPVTRRVVVGRTQDGKRLVGRILQIQKKIQPNEVKINQSTQNENTFSIAMPQTQKRPNKARKPPIAAQNNQDNKIKPPSLQMLQKYMSRSVLDDNVARTLAGLMDLESVNKKLKGRRLIVRHVQRRSREGKIIPGSKKLAYYCGKLKQKSGDTWMFAQENPLKNSEQNGIDLPINENTEKINLNDELSDDDDEEPDELLTLYLTETQDEYGKKKTKVTIPEFTSKLPTKTDDDPTCKFCGKKFQSLGSLKRHATVHDHSLRPLQCMTCLGRFSDESGLKKHMLLHTGVRPHKCTLCEKTFAFRGDLNFHLRTHDPIKRYECSICKKQFNRHSNMLRHAEIHRPSGINNEVVEVEDDEDADKTETASFTCDQCGIQYNYSSSLTRHIVNVHLKQSE